MKKLKFIIIGAALAALAIPSVASADVLRCAAPVTDPSTATFQVTQVRGEGGLWYHDYTVTVQPDGSFIGTGDVYGLDNGVKAQEFDENISGTITTVNGISTVSFTASRTFNVISTYSVTNAVMGGPEVKGETNPYPGFDINLTIGVPTMFAPTTTDLNHGEYVSSMGGGKVAAQKCTGMPLVSKQGK